MSHIWRTLLLFTVTRKDQFEGREREAVRLSLAELSEQAGVPGRTIRYYIARGILDGPVRGGRSAFYTTEHLQRLAEIRRRQESGRTLAEIEHDTKGAEPAQHLPEPQGWWMYPVSGDVVVQVRSGLSPWRARAEKSALARLAGELSSSDDGKG